MWYICLNLSSGSGFSPTSVTQYYYRIHGSFSSVQCSRLLSAVFVSRFTWAIRFTFSDATFDRIDLSRRLFTFHLLLLFVFFFFLHACTKCNCTYYIFVYAVMCNIVYKFINVQVYREASAYIFDFCAKYYIGRVI